MLSRMKEQYKNTTWFDMDAMSKTKKEVPNEAHLTHLDLKVTWLGNDRVEGQSCYLSLMPPNGARNLMRT